MGKFYQITLSLVAAVLECGDVHPSDDRTCKYRIKGYTTDEAIKELGE